MRPPMLMPIRAVLFDIDGTLFNSDALHLAAFQRVLAQYGFNGGEPISEAFFMEKISGRQNALIMADLFPCWTAEQGLAFSQYKEQTFRDLATDALPALATPGLEQLLDALEQSGVPCSAVTNAPRANAEQMLRAIGRLGWFQPLVIGDECARAKPHPEPYLCAMAALGVAAESCVVFEDSPAGVAAGVAAGAFAVGITSTQTAAALREAGCSLAVPDFSDPALLYLLQEGGIRLAAETPSRAAEEGGARWAADTASWAAG